jgi:hypothetical protein
VAGGHPRHGALDGRHRPDLGPAAFHCPMSESSVYESNPEPAPDSAFVDGDLAFLVVGNRGRLLDARRTPISVVEVDPEGGSFVVRVDAFEDTGARWELSLDEVGRFQFEREAAAASDEEVVSLERSRARFDRELVIERDDAEREESRRRLAQRREQARDWLHERAPGLKIDLSPRPTSRGGPRLGPRSCGDSVCRPNAYL